MATDDDDAKALAAGRALASPLRLRILRFCLYDARTNREIAEEFGVNPGTSLHHVRTLVETGFLAADEPRTGRRGATEIPYRATGLSWNTRIPGEAGVLVQTFLDEIEDRDPDDMFMVRMGFKLTPERTEELRRRIVDIVLEFADAPDAEGERYSLFVAGHAEERPGSS